MSAFTPVSDHTIADLLAPLHLTLDSARVATHGIENSNYLLRCHQPDGTPEGLVLTLFEQRPTTQLPWFAALLAGLAAAGLPVPAPRTVNGEAVLTVAGKPAFLVPWLPGEHVFSPTPAHCHAVGALLARLHQCHAPPGSPPHDERRHLGHLAQQLRHVPAELASAAERTLQAWLETTGHRVLSHADLFRDNVLFDGERVSGLLDLYNACLELPVYDLAVSANDWCVNDDGSLDDARWHALQDGYAGLDGGALVGSPLLPLALAAAALRFYLSRLAARELAAQHPDAQGTVSKDPEVFERIFRQRYAAWQGLNAPAR